MHCSSKSSSRLSHTAAIEDEDDLAADSCDFHNLSCYIEICTQFAEQNAGQQQHTFTSMHRIDVELSVECSIVWYYVIYLIVIRNGIFIASDQKQIEAHVFFFRLLSSSHLVCRFEIENSNMNPNDK